MKEDSIKHFPAKGDATLSGVIVDCDLETGLALKIKSYIIQEEKAQLLLLLGYLKDMLLNKKN